MSPGRFPADRVGQCRRGDCRADRVDQCHRLDFRADPVGQYQLAIAGLTGTADVSDSISGLPRPADVSGSIPGLTRTTDIDSIPGCRQAGIDSGSGQRARNVASTRFPPAPGSALLGRLLKKLCSRSAGQRATGDRQRRYRGRLMAGRRRHYRYPHSADQESFAHRVSTVVRRLLVVIRRQIPHQRLAEHLRRAEYPRSADWQRCLRRAEYPRSADWQRCLRRADFRPPRLGDFPAWANYPSMADCLQLWPPLGLRTFEVLGRDIDGVREAYIARSATATRACTTTRTCTATGTCAATRTCTATVPRCPPPPRAPPPPPRPPPPPPPRPPRAHMSLASQTHTAIETITINNFFMAAPFM